MPRRLLLAVDIKEDARELVAEATEWAVRLEATLSLVYVDAYRALLQYASEPRVRTLVTGEIARMIESDRRDLDALLLQIPHERRGEVVVRSGHPPEVVADEARHYDAVLVGSHGRGWLGHLVLGSVAGQIARHAHVPTLVVRPVARHSPARMLVAVDITDPGPVLATARAWSERLGARVDLAYVEPFTLVPTGDPMLQQLLVTEQDRQRAAHHDALTQLLAEIPYDRRGGTRVELGGAARALVDLAPDYDLVVLGTHGRTGISRAALGSVAERVARMVRKPVLLVPYRD